MSLRDDGRSVHPRWSVPASSAATVTVGAPGLRSATAADLVAVSCGSGCADGAVVALQDGLVRPVLVRTAEDPAGIAALSTAARVAAWLDHPQIETVHLAGPGRVVLRRLAGRTLAEAAPSADELARILASIAGAVAAAHARGIVHRAIAPGSIVVGDHGEAWLCGWDLAVAVTPAAAGRAPPPAPENACAGPPAYVPPEIARGDWSAISPASDVWMLGATLAHGLAGGPRPGDAAACLAAAAAGEPPPVPDTAPAGLAALVGRACAADPAARGDAAGFRAALQAWRARSAAALAAPGLRQAAEERLATGLGRSREAAYPELLAAVQLAAQAEAAEPGALAAGLRRRCAAALVRAALAAGDLTAAGVAAAGAGDLEQEVAAARAARARSEAQRLRRRRAGLIAAGVALALIALGVAAGPIEQRAMLAARSAEAARLRASIAGGEPEAALRAALRAAGLDLAADGGAVSAAALRAAHAAVAAGAAGTAAAHLATARAAGAPEDAALASRIAWLAEAPQRESRRRLARLAELRTAALSGGDPASELAAWSRDADQALVQAVAALAADPEPAVRVLAVRAAAAAGAWLDDGQLLALVADAAPAVRRAALIALVHRQPAGLLLPAARAVAAHDPDLGPLLWGWASRDRAVHAAAAADPAERELLWVCGFHREWAAGSDPDSADPAVLRRLVTAYRPQNNNQGKTRLRELGRRLAAIDPGDPEGWSAQGQAAVLWGLHAEAWAAMREGHARARDRHRLLRWYSYAAGWVGEEQALEAALAELATALREHRFTDDGERAEALICLVDHDRESDLVRSEAAALVRRNPYRLDLRLLAAQAALAAGDHAAAARHAAEASDQWPNNPEPYRLRAQALSGLGLRDDALREARLALVRQPRLGANLELHAEILLEHGRGAEAVDRARVALRMLPGNQGVCAIGVRAALRHGFPGDALAFLRTWSGGEGPQRPASVLTARLAVELGVPGEAIALAGGGAQVDRRLLQPVLAAVPALLHDGWPGMQGRALAQLNQREALALLRSDPPRTVEAAALLARAAEVDPGSPGLDLLRALAAGAMPEARRIAATAPGHLAGVARAVLAAAPGRELPLPPGEWGQRPLPELRLTAEERAALEGLLGWPLPPIPEPPPGAPRRFADLRPAVAPEGWDWPPRSMAEWLVHGEPPASGWPDSPGASPPEKP